MSWRVRELGFRVDYVFPGFTEEGDGGDNECGEGSMRQL